MTYLNKTYLTILLCILSICSFAQSPRYQQAMIKNVAMLDTARVLTTYQSLANSFERMATAEKTQWMPYYYAAYCLVRQTYSGEKKNAIDDIADHAETLLHTADSLSPGNSEIYVLMAMTNSCRISVNPMTRGKKYGTIAGTFLDKAEKADPSNPRIFLQRGMGMFYTPKMFGGGKDKAKLLYQMALDKYATFKPGSAFAPHWGNNEALDMLKKCDE